MIFFSKHSKKKLSLLIFIMRIWHYTINTRIYCQSSSIFSSSHVIDIINNRFIFLKKFWIKRLWYSIRCIQLQKHTTTTTFCWKTLKFAHKCIYGTYLILRMSHPQTNKFKKLQNSFQLIKYKLVLTR